eukprot:5772482-Heterocapsa_arctica.AAC.1
MVRVVLPLRTACAEFGCHELVLPPAPVCQLSFPLTVLGRESVSSGVSVAPSRICRSLVRVALCKCFR